MDCCWWWLWSSGSPRLMATLGLASILCALGRPALAEDIVHIATGEDGRGRTKLTGEVLDYTGRELKLKLPGGSEKLIPAERVISLETIHTAEERAADKAFKAGRFDEAASQYEKAMKAEDRTWVRRQIVAQLVWSQRSAGNDGVAGEYFVLLIRSDPATRLFDCIPLAWLPGTPSADLEQKARRWLDQDALPPAVLLGASHLLLAAQGTAAATKLSKLTDNDDPRIALLARAQLWRKQVASSTNKQLTDWREAIERMPQPLRAGPYFVLGRALAQQQEHEPAALELLRVPILYPRERALSARALFEAGRSLEKLDQTAEAARLYREIVAHYPTDTVAAEAQEKLRSAKGKKQ